MIVPLKLPPGAFRNGTEYQAKGRWRDVNLVRWQEGAMRPVGGWNGIGGWYSSGVFGAVVRGAMSWIDNSGNQWVIFGTKDGVWVTDENGVIYDITPGGFSSGATWPTEGDTVALGSTWSFWPFGQLPIGCMSEDGGIYEWDLNTGNVMTAVSGAPTGCTGVVTTEERFIFALGDGGDPRSLKWCDREDRTQWTPAVGNQAGGWDLKTEGELYQGLPMRGETLIITSRDLWSSTYVGYPDVYAFRRIGQAGAVSRHAWVRVNDSAYGWADGGFWAYSGGYLQRLSCDVLDYVLTDIDFGNRGKVSSWHNREFGEVWWLYEADSSGTDVDRYVAYNYLEDNWHYGICGATTMVDAAPFVNPWGFHDVDPSSPFSTIASETWNHGTNWQGTTTLSQSAPAASSTTADAAGFQTGVKFFARITVTGRTAGTVTVDIDGDDIDISDNSTQHLLFTADGTTVTITVTADGTWDGTVTVLTTYFPFIQEHETGNLYYSQSVGAQTPYAKSGPLDIGDGERRVHVTNLIPDEQDQGELKYTFGHREYPTASETNETAVTAANPTDVRFSGRQFTMKVEPDSANTDWRCGTQRLEIALGGRR